MLSQDFNSYVDYLATILVEHQRLLLCGYLTYRQEIQSQFWGRSNVVGHHGLLSSEGNFHNVAPLSRYTVPLAIGIVYVVQPLYASIQSSQ
ncbi:hypothetical protein T4C_13049 [Trichinella pseudospiralis]|uniref:Uncharacterized protein n=1 Tax=Trichinella pseudospiralis TaxID=6337 RepID=A0A0V1JIS5_TRIPS|nr:hypothetical protein T4C_13049 [Trichinella pseudospiralis]